MLDNKSAHSLSTCDYIVMGALLVFSSGIGVFYAVQSRKKQSTQEYLMAGRNMNPIPVALSLLSTFMSAVTLIGTPSEIYLFGTQFSLMVVSFVIVIAASSYIYIPVFYNIKATSSFEYLGIRFGKSVRLVGSFLMSIQMIMYMALVLYAPSLALHEVTGLSIQLSVVAIGLVCTFYTTIGGMKAVMWTDAFQITLMFAAVIVLVVEGFSVVGREVVFERSQAGGRIEFGNFNPSPLERHTVWTLVVGGFFTWLSVYGVSQAQVQRCLSVASLKNAQIALYINVVGLVALYCILTLLGLVVYAYYYMCDPLSSKMITKIDQLTPYFMMQMLGKYSGLPGLFVAGLFSGSLSTISSGVNALATTVLVDFIKPFICLPLTENAATWVSKVLALVFGLLCIGLAFVAELLPSILQAAFSIYGMIGGPLLGVFTLGMLFPWANTKGAFLGLITGLATIIWIGVGAQIYKYPPKLLPLHTYNCSSNFTQLIQTNVTSPEYKGLSIYRLSYLWYSGFSSLIVIVVGHIVTFCTGKIKGLDLDPSLIFPLFYKLAFFLPEKTRQKLLYGIRYNGEYGVYSTQYQNDLNQPITDNGLTKNNIGNVNTGFTEDISPPHSNTQL